MSVDNHDAAMDAIKDSIAAALPQRYVQRDLADPANAPRAHLLAGLVCVVTEGGGNFANYRGREGDLGTMDVRLVGFVQVGEKSAPADIERAELNLLGDVLRWVSTTAVPGLDVVYPGDWQVSKQLEHPYGWMTLQLKVHT